MIIKYYTKHNRKDYWLLMNDIIYTIWFEKVIIKWWFVFDWGSIPTFAWMFTYHPLQMPFLEYFILHDYFWDYQIWFATV